MALFSFLKKDTDKDENTVEKLNPGQRYMGGVIESSPEPVFLYEKAYENIEVVSRGVNMIVDDAADIPTKVGSKTKGIAVVKGMRQDKLNTLLNVEANPFQDINTFRRNLIIDLILDGNIFIYFDGVHLYHLPAKHVEIHTSKTSYIEKYTFKTVTYRPSEIIHIKDNSFYSIYRCVPRLRSAIKSMKLLLSMVDFQQNFFDNGAVPGLIVSSPNTLSEKIKEKLLQAWSNRYNPRTGGRSPIILDGGLEVQSLTDNKFAELDFESSITTNENKILKALGVPPILLNSGNNANIRPNIRLFYLETVIPIVKKLNYAYSRYFGYELWEDVTDTAAMQPELKDQASYFSVLVNGGIMSPAEARDKLGLDVIPGHDDLRIPANIAGSAGDPSEGGRPTGETE